MKEKVLNYTVFFMWVTLGTLFGFFLSIEKNRRVFVAPLSCGARDHAGTPHATPCVIMFNLWAAHNMEIFEVELKEIVHIPIKQTKSLYS